MRRSVVLALFALGACTDQMPGPTGAVPAADEDRAAYIVVLRQPNAAGPSLSRADVERVAAGVTVPATRVFTRVIPGFAADLTPSQVAALRRRPDVAYVEPDAPVTLFTTQSNPISWGLDRVDDYNLPLDQTYTYYNTGAGVQVYVLDSGINLNHLDYIGRANYIPNGSNGDFVGDGHGSAADCHGHGSHVSGTVGGTYSGIAKGVTIYAGRVANCSGGGNASMAIAGMDWIRANGLKPAVVNMSLGYGDLQSVRDAATNLVQAGFVVVAAAGNGNFQGTPLNACNESPGGASTVITVGATDVNDREASFSNYGSCVDLLAPGVAIYSSDYLVTNQVVSRSGTSMAAPHVAGVAAQILQQNPTASPAWIWSAIQSQAVTGTITRHFYSVAGGTPNRFLRALW